MATTCALLQQKTADMKKSWAVNPYDITWSTQPTITLQEMKHNIPAGASWDSRVILGFFQGVGHKRGHNSYRGASLIIKHGVCERLWGSISFNLWPVLPVATALYMPLLGPDPGHGRPRDNSKGGIQANLMYIFISKTSMSVRLSDRCCSGRCLVCWSLCASVTADGNYNNCRWFAQLISQTSQRRVTLKEQENQKHQRQEYNM